MDELGAILDQAAALAVEHGAEPDEFMSAAHDACLRANPELREQIERTNILEQVWGWSYPGGTRTVDVHIHGLREKIEVDPLHPIRIVTVRGAGYRFEG